MISNYWIQLLNDLDLPNNSDHTKAELLFIRFNSDIQTCLSKSMLSCRLHLSFSWQIQDIKGNLLSRYSYCILQIAFAIR